MPGQTRKQNRRATKASNAKRSARMAAESAKRTTAKREGRTRRWESDESWR